MEYKDREPCTHKGCLSHITHPCEVCGRIAGRNATRVKKRGVFFNREYLTRIYVLQNGEDAIRIVTYKLDKASLYVTRINSLPFSKVSFSTIVEIYLTMRKS